MTRTALITGASRNIGRTLALRYAQAGYAVVINSRRAQAVDDVRREIEARGGRALAHACDVRDPEAVDAMAAAARDAFGGVDVLVNNAVVRVHEPLEQTTQQDWQNVIDVILTGAFNCARAVMPDMQRSGWGRILNFSGVAAQKGSANRVAIVSAKAGVLGMTRGLATELAPHGITVNAISPGLIDTDRQGFIADNPRAAQHYTDESAAIPLGRMGTQDEIAELCLFLSGHGGAYVTGQTISVNGGLYMA